MMSYENTHTFFKTGKHWTHGTTCDEIILCREQFGDNDIAQALHLRPWFTDYEGVWIRKDCLDDKLVTWFTLKILEYGKA